MLSAMIYLCAALVGAVIVSACYFFAGLFWDASEEKDHVTGRQDGWPDGHAR
jgi:hypothetical protein